MNAKSVRDMVMEKSWKKYVVKSVGTLLYPCNCDHIVHLTRCSNHCYGKTYPGNGPSHSIEKNNSCYHRKITFNDDGIGREPSNGSLPAPRMGSPRRVLGDPAMFWSLFRLVPIIHNLPEISAWSWQLVVCDSLIG